MVKNLVCLLSAMTLVTACAGATSDDGSASDEAITSSMLSATAVNVHFKPMRASFQEKNVTLGSPAKVNKIIKAIKKTRPSDSPIRCIPTGTEELRFFDASGAEKASVSFTCGWGTLKIGSQETQVKLDGNIDTVVDAPLVPDDALWGITEVSIKKVLGNKTATITKADDIETLVEAVKDDAIHPTAAVPRCLPTYVVTFKRGQKEAASAAFSCAAPSATTTEIQSTFTVPGPTSAFDVTGPVGLDPRPFLELAPN